MLEAMSNHGSWNLEKGGMQTRRSCERPGTHLINQQSCIVRGCKTASHFGRSQMMLWAVGILNPWFDPHGRQLFFGIQKYIVAGLASNTPSRIRRSVIGHLVMRSSRSPGNTMIMMPSLLCCGSLDPDDLGLLEEFNNPTPLLVVEVSLE